MNYRILAITFIALFILSSCSKEEPTDPNQLPDNNTNVTICGQVWMDKNLDVDHYRNGDSIPEITDPTEWVHTTTGAWCYYNNDRELGKIYGKLYNWFAVNDPRGLAPKGWHIPSYDEWGELANCLGGYSIAGGKLKKTGGTYWNHNNTGATNETGFSALPGGGCYGDTGTFTSIGEEGFWWTTTESENLIAYCIVMHCDFSWLGSGVPIIESSCHSVRCLKD